MIIQTPCRIRSVRLLIVAAWAACLPVAAAHSDETLLLDFDTHSISDGWSRVGEMEFSAQPLPEAMAETSPGLHPAGQGLSIQTSGPAGLFVKDEQLVPRDWSRFRDLSLWIYRDPAEASRHPTTVMEIHVSQRNTQADFWRRVDLAHAGWKRITLPLCWFRWGSTVPRWEEADRLGIRFREPAHVVLDTITVEVGESGSAYLRPEELRRLAFPESPPSPGRTDSEDRQALPSLIETQTDHVSIVSNAPRLEAQRLADHLETVVAAVRRDLPFLDPPARPPVLLIFAERLQYQAFTPRLAQQLGSSAKRPESGGYTLHGVSTSYWDERQGTLRPVYTHEFLHGYMAHSARFANRGEWLHEGLATLYQLRFHPQADVAKIIADGLTREDFRLPLGQLCNGEPIPLNRYWQAMTVVEMLLIDERYKAQLADLFSAFRESGSTDLGPHLKTLWGTDWTELTRHWEAHCRAR